MRRLFSFTLACYIAAAGGYVLLAGATFLAGGFGRTLAQGMDPHVTSWAGLSVREEGSRDDYDRSSFGRIHERMESQIVETLPRGEDGSIRTPYTCTLLSVLDDGSTAGDIEHIVSLVEAHESGLPEDQRRAFSADIDNLTIALARVNRTAKADRDAAEWQPRRNRGWYARRVVEVKRKYGLAVDPQEGIALWQMIDAHPAADIRCP